MTDQLIMTTAQRDKQYAALENSIDAVTQEITDHKAMWGEEAIPSRVAQRQNLVLKEREHKDAMEMLQSLPMVSAEPVAFYLIDPETGWNCYYSHDEISPAVSHFLTPLYTSPQAPVLVDSEPVATVKSWTNGSYWRNYKIDWNKDVPEGTKLYTSPQALTPSEPLEELLGQYWDIGYKEGQYGEPNGDKANEVLHKIRMLFKPITPITADALKELHHIDEFGLFCSFEEFEQIARAIEQKHGIVNHRGEA